MDCTWKLRGSNTLLALHPSRFWLRCLAARSSAEEDNPPNGRKRDPGGMGDSGVGMVVRHRSDGGGVVARCGGAGRSNSSTALRSLACTTPRLVPARTAKPGGGVEARRRCWCWGRPWRIGPRLEPGDPEGASRRGSASSAPRGLACLPPLPPGALLALFGSGALPLAAAGAGVYACMAVAQVAILPRQAAVGASSEEHRQEAAVGASSEEHKRKDE